jgi:hypothetical protein
MNNVAVMYLMATAMRLNHWAAAAECDVPVKK